jgi:phenylpropionate dioxygenase-like ring-hydroxylating dioxygenase large terminal subunit
MDLNNIKNYIDDRPGDGVFRVHKDVYSDPQLFELEMKYIFERTWSFLGHESQLPKPHDWIATHIGRVPVLIARDAKGKVGAFLNACRHKGARLTRTESGNRKFHVCPYHGWAYGSDGRNVDVKDKKDGHYTAAFDNDSHDLIPLARIASYKGLLFGSLSADVPELTDFLGELRFFIDLAMEQGEHGMEFVPGRIEYAYNANWKLQLDNGTDAYHLTSTHTSFLDVMAKRAMGEGNQEARQFDWQKRFSQEGGDFQFANGHTCIWLNQAEVVKRPIYPGIDVIRERVGTERADWMLKMRNMSVFPNMQIADSTSLLLRTFRPLAVDRTEMRYWCMAPVGEPPAQRAWRIRQFEDFFNVSGFATPDDTVTYETCQAGFSANELDWLQGHCRGSAALQPGPNDLAQSLGFNPVASLKGGFSVQSETSFQPVYREWARLMQAGISGSKAYG